MQTNTLSIWWPRAASLILAGLAAASATFWMLKVTALGNSGNAPAAASASPIAIDPDAVVRALGGGQAMVAAAPVPTNVSSRFAMLGVIADPRTGAGAALLSVDGKPAKPFRVGSLVEDGLVLHSVKGRTATLAPSLDAAPVVTLELPPLKP